MYWWEEKGKWFDCFLVLGISENATEDEVKKAYRALMKELHPDVNPNYDADEISRIELAYNTLTSSKTRDKYKEHYRRLKKSKDEQKENTEEKPKTFDEVLKDYKESEKQLKVMVSIMINDIEEKEKQFSMLYDQFCESIKNGEINSKSFEIRKQKMRSILLAGVNNITEVIQMIVNNLNNINFNEEIDLIKKVQDSYKAKDDILTSNFSQAKKILSSKKVVSAKKSKLKLSTKFELAFIASMFLFGIYFVSPLGRFWDEKEVVEETSEESEEIQEEVQEEVIVADETKDIDLSDGCILFESVPETMEYDSMTDPFEYAGREVIRARKDGIQYLLDASDMHVLIANYLSSGPVIIDRDTFDCVLVFLGIDGRDYTVDISDFRTVLNVREAYSSESEPFYLDGYGYVIETESHGGKHLIDAETRESLVDLYDTYSELHYDDTLESDVYCFTNAYTDTYVQADDLKKVLKVEHN